MDDVLRRSRWLAGQARQYGGYRIAGTVREAQSPALFRGSAGIGYVFLRLARPKSLPSVLLLEP